MKIILNAKSQNRSRKQGYFELHHILPKSLFPLWKNNKNNKVLLTAREHWFVHQLLVKIYPGKSMLYTQWRLANDHQNKICNGHDYEKLRLQISKEISRKRKNGELKGFSGHHTEETKKLISKKVKQAYQNGFVTWNKGKHISEKQKEHLRNLYLGKTLEDLYGEEKAKQIRSKLSKQRKGKSKNRLGTKWSEQQREKMKKYKWWTNGIIDKKCEICPDGFWKGRVTAHGKN